MKATARGVAASALCACFRYGAWSELKLKELLAESGLDSRDAALATQLCYGVLQNLYLLDYAIAGASRLPLKKLQPQVLQLLRLGAYQLYFLDRIPVPAIVNETVGQAARTGNRKAAGFVNGVLRALSRDRSLPPLPEDLSWEESLSLRTSHPLWLIRRIEQEIGREEAGQFFVWNNAPHPTVIQFNPLKTTPEQLHADLEEEGMEVSPHPLLPGCFLLKRTGNLTKSQAFSRGAFMVQDAAARMAVLAASPRPGSAVLDLCAAPGGKSLACAQLMGDRGTIVSCDKYPHKLPLIERNARRLGIHTITARCSDAAAFVPEFREAFDLVLADVPCSGLGIIGKKPDIRYKDPEKFTELSQLSMEILKNAAIYVKLQGNIVYSTCTVLRSENQEIIETFLKEHSNFVLESFSLPGLPEVVSGMLTLWPQRHETDGFFIARLRRIR